MAVRAEGACRHGFEPEKPSPFGTVRVMAAAAVERPTFARRILQGLQLSRFGFFDALSQRVTAGRKSGHRMGVVRYIRMTADAEIKGLVIEQRHFV